MRNSLWEIAATGALGVSFSIISLYTVVALLSLTTRPVLAVDCEHGPYFNFYNGPNALNQQRLDPALFPGVRSPHLHDFDGGNLLSLNIDMTGLRRSNCTNNRIKFDNSLYWHPVLYWDGNNTGYYKVPKNYNKIYYFFGDPDNVKAPNITEFPPGFTMIAGDSYNRQPWNNSENTNAMVWGCGSGPRTAGIQQQRIPQEAQYCDSQGFSAYINFPSCWNGEPFNRTNPRGHMAYPTETGTGIYACPEGFRVARFPKILIEVWWDINEFAGTSTVPDPFVLSNGDPTGYGWHADFVNGWDEGTLDFAMRDNGYCNCGCKCDEETLIKCFGAENVYTDEQMKTSVCRAPPAFPGEDHDVVSLLPGCNPIQSGPARATQARDGPGCATPSIQELLLPELTAAESSNRTYYRPTLRPALQTVLDV